MPEFEELRLEVSLVDNASAGLQRLGAQIRALTSQTNEDAFSQLSKQVNQISTALKGLEKQSQGSTEAAEQMVSRFKMAGQAFAAMGGIAVAQFASLKLFANELVRLGDAARVTGTNVGQIDAMVKAMERFGISTSEGIETVKGISAAMADFARGGLSEIKKSIMESGHMSEAQRANWEAFAKVAERLSKEGKTAEVGNLINKTIHESVELGMREGLLTKEQAAQARNKLANEIFKTPGLARFEGVFDELNAAQKAQWTANEQAARNFNNQLSSIWVNIKRIGESGMAEWLTDNRVNKTLEATKDLTGYVADNIARWGKEVRDFISIFNPVMYMMREKKTGEDEPGSMFNFFNLVPSKRTRGGQTSSQKKRSDELQPQRFSGGGDEGDHRPDIFNDADDAYFPHSTNIEDRRGENLGQRRDLDKHLFENTEQLKLLNDWLYGRTTDPLRFSGGGGFGGGGATGTGRAPSGGESSNPAGSSSGGGGDASQASPSGGGGAGGAGGAGSGGGSGGGGGGGGGGGSAPAMPGGEAVPFQNMPGYWPNAFPQDSATFDERFGAATPAPAMQGGAAVPHTGMPQNWGLPNGSDVGPGTGVGARAGARGGGGFPFRTTKNKEVEKYVGFDRAIANMDPETRARVQAAYRDMPDHLKPSFLVNEGWRSYEYQKFLYDTKSGRGMVARPGHSRHEGGQAIDVDEGPARDWLRRNAGKYGLQGLKGDAPHFQRDPSYRGKPFLGRDGDAPIAPEPDRGVLDKTMGKEITGTVEGSANVKVKVDGGSKPAEPETLFKPVPMSKYQQMEPAASSQHSETV